MPIDLGPVCFVDTETSGLDPDRHQIWEVALITPDEVEHHWFLPIDEARADLIALNIGGYFDRHPQSAHLALHIHQLQFVRDFQALTRGLHLAGAVVSFDADRLYRLMITHGVLPAWHYHLIDVEALAVGRLATAANEHYEAGFDVLAAQTREQITPPWDSTWLSSAVGVPVELFDRHTALGDARWAKAIYEAVMG